VYPYPSEELLNSPLMLAAFNGPELGAVRQEVIDWIAARCRDGIGRFGNCRC